MTPEATKKHIGAQFFNSGLSNGVLNVLFLWLLNRDMPFMSYGDIASDALFTAGFISLLVTWPTAYFTRKAVAAGLPPCGGNGGLVAMLPRRWPLLWLTLWLSSAGLLELALFALFHGTGLPGLSFASTAVLKFAYCSLLGGGLGMLVAFRYCQPDMHVQIL